MTERKTRILIVDDEEIIHLALELIFADWSQPSELISIIDPTEALQILESDIDIVLTDLAMPSMHGSDLLSLIKSAFPNIPVIVITGFHSKEEQEILLAKGANGILNKPFLDLEKFFFCIESALNQSTKKIT